MNDELNPQRAIGDIYFVALLLSHKIRPVRVDRNHPKYQRFIFNEHLNCKFWIMEDGDVPMLMALDLSELETYYFAKQVMFIGAYPECLKEVKASLQSVMQ
jgi:hypothetical protein